MNDETALLGAILAHPDEDTPRLVYADWLDENDAPLQADLIRTQCRLASCSAADPDYPDLLERHAELVAQFGPIARMTVPELPPGFAFQADLTHGTENFRRGFPYTVQSEWGYGEPTNEQLDRLRAGLPRLMATTTVRQLTLQDVSGERLEFVLASPGAADLSGLVIGAIGHAEPTPADRDAALRVLARSGAAAHLESLSLHRIASGTGLGALGPAKFPRLARLHLPSLYGRESLAVVTSSAWFQQLRHVRADHSRAPLERELVTALAQLPRLESLDLHCGTVGARKAMGARRGFPALAHLELWPTPSENDAKRLARAPFPLLAELEIRGMTDAPALALLGAPWSPQLRSLTFRKGTLTEKFVRALAKSGAAANVRILKLADQPFGKRALSILCDGDRFPNVTTLDLEMLVRHRLKSADLVKIVNGLSLPRLRHLNLNWWPLGDAGAKALAANPALAHVTRLSCVHCRIGEKGLTALARSPHLQQLIDLDVQHNQLKSASALLDTDLLPRLAAVRMDGNSIPTAARRKLHAARGLVA